MLRFGHEIRWCFAVADVPQSHAFCDWRAGWPQDVANMRNKLKSLSFSPVSEVALGPFLSFLCYVLGTKLDSVVADVLQSHTFCDWRASWPQDVANTRNELK